MASRSGWRRQDRNSPAALARQARYRTPEYRAESKRLAALVEAGNGFCHRCHRWINPAHRTPWGHRAWHVGHDPSGLVILGAEHYRCNLSDAGQRARARQDASRLRW